MKYRLADDPSKDQFLVMMYKADGNLEAGIMGDFYINLLTPASDSSLSKLIYIISDSISHEGDINENTIKYYAQRFYTRGIEKVSSQFQEKIAEIGELVHKMYDILPQAKSFIKWYNKVKLRPYIDQHTSIVWVGEILSENNIFGSIIDKLCFAATIYPEVSYSDLQEYCFYLQQELQNNDRQLRLALRSTANPAKKKRVIGSLKLRDSKLVDALYEKMNNVYFNCSLEEFRGVCGTGPFVGRVKWRESDGAASEMLFFIYELEDKNFRNKPKKQNWKLIQSLFEKSTGESFDENLRNIYKGIEDKLSHKTASDISSIIDSLKLEKLDQL